MSSSHNLASPSGRRRPPLLVLLAASVFILVCVGGVALVAARFAGQDNREGRSAAGGAPVADETERSASPQPRAPTTPPPRPATTPSTPAPARAPEAPSEELPVWARRPPPDFTMPWPPGGAYDPPLPPVHLPPEMLPQPDAGGPGAAP